MSPCTLSPNALGRFFYEPLARAIMEARESCSVDQDALTLAVMVADLVRISGDPECAISVFTDNLRRLVSSKLASVFGLFEWRH